MVGGHSDINIAIKKDIAEQVLFCCSYLYDSRQIYIKNRDVDCRIGRYRYS